MLLIWLEVIMPWNILWFCDWKLMILDFLCTAAAALWSFSEENNFLPRHLLLDTHQHRYHGNSFLFNQILYIFLSFFGMLHPHIHTSSYKLKDSHHVVRHAVLAAASEAVELLRVPSQGRRLSTPVQSWVPPAIDDVSKMHFCPWHAPNNVNQSYEHNIRGSRFAEGEVNLALISGGAGNYGDLALQCPSKPSPNCLMSRQIRGFSCADPYKWTNVQG